MTGNETHTSQNKEILTSGDMQKGHSQPVLKRGIETGMVGKRGFQCAQQRSEEMEAIQGGRLVNPWNAATSGHQTLFGGSIREEKMAIELKLGTAL